MRSKYTVVRALLFLALGAALFMEVQALLSPRWVWPQFKESTENTLAELETLKNSDIQAFFLGASPVEFGVDPMRIYEESGLVTFNLATSAQTMELSYYMLAEGFKTAAPKVVLLDASRLFSGSFENSSYRYVMDAMPLSGNKIALAEAYADNFPEEKRPGTFLGVLFPIYQYHDRWEELWKNDFVFQEYDWNYFTKGYFLNTNTCLSGMNIPWMNEIAQIDATVDGWTLEITDGETVRTADREKLYTPTVDRGSLRRFLDIKALCEENGAELRLIGIPNCIEPQYEPRMHIPQGIAFRNASLGSDPSEPQDDSRGSNYFDPQYKTSAWTTIKYELVKDVAAEYGVPYLDLMYDVDIGIDWDLDSCDGGWHLNHRGAKKVADHLIGYLTEECGLKGHYDAEYESDRPIYDAVTKVAELQMTQSLREHLQLLADLEDITVFFSVSDDMMRHLSPEDRAALNGFGLQMNFDELAYSDAYLAVKEGNVVSYEASSNRTINKSGTLQCGASYSLVSSGWYATPKSSIQIDGTEYSMDRRGINIVVYDERSKGVLDSVTFDTWNDGDQSAIRNTEGTLEYSPLSSYYSDVYLLNYEYFLMENGVQ